MHARHPVGGVDPGVEDRGAGGRVLRPRRPQDERRLDCRLLAHRHGHRNAPRCRRQPQSPPRVREGVIQTPRIRHRAVTRRADEAGGHPREPLMPQLRIPSRPARLDRRARRRDAGGGRALLRPPRLLPGRAQPARGQRPGDADLGRDRRGERRRHDARLYRQPEPGGRLHRHRRPRRPGRAWQPRLRRRADRRVDPRRHRLRRRQHPRELHRTLRPPRRRRPRDPRRDRLLRPRRPARLRPRSPPTAASSRWRSRTSATRR